MKEEQELICISNDPWYRLINGRMTQITGPIKDEIVIYDGANVEGGIYLKAPWDRIAHNGLREGWLSHSFVPIISTEELVEAITLQEELV